LQTLKISKKAKLQVEAMLRAAANPASESPEVVIATLPKERQADIALIQQAIGAQFRSRITRGSSALLQMDEGRWQQLVSEANGDP
jgi:hypothetical protein